MDAVQLSGKSSGGKIVINQEANGVCEVCNSPSRKSHVAHVVYPWRPMQLPPDLSRSWLLHVLMLHACLDAMVIPSTWLKYSYAMQNGHVPNGHPINADRTDGSSTSNVRSLLSQNISLDLLSCRFSASTSVNTHAVAIAQLALVPG